jgi:outer membrane protein TolC
MDLTNESFFYRINFIRVVIALFSVGVMLFSACKPVGPDYTAPTENIPDDWDQQVLSRLTKEPKTDIENWWVLFNDTTLTELIGLAGSNNRNLKMAFSRVVASRAEVSGVSGSKLPDVEASASASESKISDEGRFNQMAP